MTPEQYIAHGFRVVPVGSNKRPKLSGFGADNPTFCAQPSDFGPDDSVGVLCGPCPAAPPGKWLVCLDFDGDVPDHELPCGTLVTHEGRHAWHWVRSDCGLKQWGDALRTKDTEGWAVDVRWAGGYAREVGDFDPSRITSIEPHHHPLKGIFAARKKPADEVTAGARASDCIEVSDAMLNALAESLAEAHAWGDDDSGRYELAWAVGRALRFTAVPRPQVEAIATAAGMGAKHVERVINGWCEAEADGLGALAAAWGEKAGGFVVMVQQCRDSDLARAPKPAEKSNDVNREVKAPGETNPWVAAVRPPDWVKERAEVVWVIDRLVAQGEPTLIVAGPGVGKSTAAISMALHVAAGRTLWGSFGVDAGPVVHIDYEQQGSLRRSYQELARGAGIDLDATCYDLRIVAPPPDGLLTTRQGAVDREAQRKLETNLAGLCRGAKLCVVNSLAAATPGIDENSKDVGEALTTLGRVAEATGCAMVVLHHTGRAASDRARGSTGIDAQAQAILVLEGVEDCASADWMQTKDRLGVGKIEPFRLAWARDGGAQTLKLAERPKPLKRGEKTTTLTDQAIDDAILSRVERAGDTLIQVCDFRTDASNPEHIPCGHVRKYERIAALVSSGKLHRSHHPGPQAYLTIPFCVPG